MLRTNGKRAGSALRGLGPSSRRIMMLCIMATRFTFSVLLFTKKNILVRRFFRER